MTADQTRALLPAASAPASCGHGAILREAAEYVEDSDHGATAHIVRATSTCEACGLASRLRAAADAAGKEGG